MGFRFRKKDKVWFKMDSNSSLAEYYKTFASTRQLSCITYPDGYERSGNYRRTFFQSNPPHFRGRYFCAYCGRLLSSHEVSVDHIIPISKAKRNRFSQWMLDRLHIEDINDKRNLASSCPYCNIKKGKKVGLWTIRGFLGKHRLFWIMAYALFIIYILLLIILAIEVMTIG